MGEGGGELAGGGEALVFAELLDVLGELVVDALELIASGFDVAALGAFAVSEEAGDDAGDAEGGELDDLILGVKAVRAPVADDGGREQYGGEEEGADGAAPAEDEAGEEEGKDVEVVENVVENDGVRGDEPDEGGEDDDHGGDEAGHDGSGGIAQAARRHGLILPREAWPREGDGPGQSLRGGRVHVRG